MTTTNTYLMVTVDGGGNMPPMLGMARQLKARGHDIHVLTEPCLQAVVTDHDFHFHPFTDYFTRTDRSEDIFRDWNKKGMKDPTLDNVVFGPANTVVEQTLKAIDKTQPDVLIVDMLLIPALMAGEKRGLPTAVGFHMPEYFPADNRPPGMMGLLPGKGPLGRLRDKLLGGLFHKVFDSYLKDLNAVRQELDLPALSHTVDLVHQADLRLIMTSRVFDFPMEPAPANVRYTGPILQDPDWVAEWAPPWPAEDKRPLVVVAFSSTFQNQGAVLRHCITALSQLPVRALVTTGPALAMAQLPEADNVVVVDSAPHSQVFPHAELVITHAGHGTVMRALSFDVPLLCMPMGRDQHDNAAKVKYHGAGLTLKKSSGVSAIRQKVQRLLEDDAFADGASRLGTQIRKDGASTVLVKELEGIAQRHISARQQPMQQA